VTATLDAIKDFQPLAQQVSANQDASYDPPAGR